MPTTTGTALSDDLWAGQEYGLGWNVPDRERLPVYLRDAAPETWVWCFRCERAFELTGAQIAHDVSCAYADCGGSPLDFWRWDAYRAFTSGEMTPTSGVRYPLVSRN